jgi:thymidylate synthase (FAD)
MKAELITCSGDDLMVVNAARVSFDKESEWDLNEYQEIDGHINYMKITQELLPSDKKLINYLAKHNHFTPFTHCMITLRETVPIFVARQRFKHTVGFSYNEVSRRYVDGDPEFYVPETWRIKADNKKQGSILGKLKFPYEQEDIYGMLDDVHFVCLKYYKEMLEAGIAPEQARMVLPQSMYTSYYVTGSLAAFARAYKLRIQPDAQVEIQELSKQWNDIIISLYPVSWEALVG